MQKFVKMIAVSALVATTATAANAGGWGWGGGGAYGSYNHSNKQLLNVSPSVDVGGVLNGLGILSGNDFSRNSILNGNGVLSGLNVLGGNTKVNRTDNSRHYRFNRRGW